MCLGCGNHHGDLHGVIVGVRKVAEDEQRSLVSEQLSYREVPELGADVLHRGSLGRTHTHTDRHTHTHTDEDQLLILSNGEK